MEKLNFINLRQVLSEAELAGKITDSEAVALIEALRRIEEIVSSEVTQ